MKKSQVLIRIEKLTKECVEGMAHGLCDLKKTAELNKLTQLWDSMIKKIEKKGGEK